MSVIVCAAVAIMATVMSPAFAGEPAGEIGRLAWLQGCWQATSSQHIVEEQWMAPRGGTMLAMSRTVRGERLSEYELVLVREQGGRLAYEAHPSGQPAAVFLSRTVDATTVVFENPEHDFPQEVGYQQTGATSLLAWIAGVSKGAPRRIEFRYQRVPCAGDP